jgi:uncharacterized membrane protein YcaP (DUF421 family)
MIDKNVTEVNIIDLIIIVLSSNMIINSKTFLGSIIAISFLIAFKLISKYIIPIVPTLRYVVFNRKAIVIKDGKINFKEMMKRQYKFNDLLNELKNRNIKRIEDVDYALLEYNNNLIIKNDKEVPIPIIWDGRVDYLSLRLIHKNINWINKIIEKEKISLENIFCAFYKKRKVYIIQNK